MLLKSRLRKFAKERKEPVLKIGGRKGSGKQ